MGIPDSAFSGNALAVLIHEVFVERLASVA
jgi:hypothetical protein